jgi:hypothetical protein
MGEMVNAYKILVESLKRPLGRPDLGVCGKIILKWILGNVGSGVLIEFIWLMTGSSCELL